MDELEYRRRDPAKLAPTIAGFFSRLAYLTTADTLPSPATSVFVITLGPDGPELYLGGRPRTSDLKQAEQFLRLANSVVRSGETRGKEVSNKARELWEAENCFA